MLRDGRSVEVSRIIEGRLPSTGRMHKITLYANGGIRIERDGFPVLEEKDWVPHRWLVWLIEPGAIRDERF